MSIDWFTLIAQIINLLILLFLLRKFLYLPVLKAVEIRQKLIADELKKAEQSRLKAEKAEALSLQKVKDIENAKQQILADAQREAVKLAADMRQDAQNQYIASKEQWQQRLQNEQKNFDISVQKLTAEHFNRFADKAFRQMADEDLNVWTVKQFMQKIKNMPDKELSELQDNFHSQNSLQIQSALELNDQLRAELEDLLREHCRLSAQTKFVYQINRELVCGIVVQAEEYMIEWSFNTYLEEFKQTMANEINRLIARGAA